MEIYVIRHGQTDWNVERRIQGHTNTPLNETGKLQALNLAKKLENINFDLIISSPLSRASETANTINYCKNLPIIYNDLITERRFGKLEGKIDLSEYDCNIDMLLNYSLNYNKYNVEPLQSFFTRVETFLNDCKSKYSNKIILISTHGGVAQAIEVILNHLPLDTNLQSLSLNNCEYRHYVL